MLTVISNRYNEAEDFDELFLEGEIGASFFDNSGTDATMFRGLLAGAKGKTLLLDINSPGGSFFDGLSMYHALRNSGKHVITRVSGVAASAASLVFMGGNERILPNGCRVMIHCVSGGAWGNAADMERAMEQLKNFDNDAAAIYSECSISGVSADEFLKLMQAETWMGVADALAYGVATASEGVDAVAANLEYEKAKNKFLQKEEILKDLNELKEKYPELYNEAVQIGRDAVALEATTEAARVDGIKAAAHATQADLVEQLIKSGATVEDATSQILLDIKNRFASPPVMGNGVNADEIKNEYAKITDPKKRYKFFNEHRKTITK